MSILLNNDLIWVSVPRCASTSIERTLLQINDIPIKHVKNYDYDYIVQYKNKNSLHIHMELHGLYENFGYKNSICINREWFDRIINSSLSNIYLMIKKNKLTPKVKYCDLNNDFLYETLDKEFANDLYEISKDSHLNCLLKFIKEDKYEVLNKCGKPHNIPTSTCVLRSQKYWINNEDNVLTFDIKEIDKFENFIEDRYKINFKLPKLNSAPKVKTKIIPDPKLKKYLWDILESRFEKNKKLI